MNSRIHRTGPNSIDVDFYLTSTLILTVTVSDHQSAVNLKQQFDEFPPPYKVEFLKELLRSNNWGLE